jgi:branched-subunit amino acid aminotransferase/4-amino-4-deoxychorismate lyase
MQDAVCRRFHRLGFSLVDRPIRPEALPDADTILLTNTLMGVVPAASLDGRPLKVDPVLISSLNKDLFKPVEVGDGLR